MVCKPILVFSLSLSQAEQQAGAELCQAQVKLEVVDEDKVKVKS